MTTLLLATRHSDERIIPSLRQQYITLSEATAGLYGELLDLTGRQITPPFTPEHFATSILAIAQGFGNRAAVESTPQEEITQSRTFNDLLDSRSPSDHERSFGLLVTELAYGMSTSPEDTADKS